MDELINSSGENWDGPYLKGGVIPKDPWGNEFTYRADKKFVVITSQGDGDGPAITNLPNGATGS